MTINKLLDSANLNQLMTSFESGVNEIETIKNEIANTLISKKFNVTQENTLRELSEKIKTIETLEEMTGDSDGITMSKEYNCIYRNYTGITINGVKTYGTNLTSINIDIEYSTEMKGKVRLRDLDSSENLLISVDNKKLIKRSCSNSGKYWEHNLNNNNMDCVNVDKRDNSIIICYSSERCIEKLNSNGGVIWSLNITGSQPLLCCSIDKEGYIATGGYDKKVQRVSPNGSLLFEYAGFTNYITAIATDSQGNIILGGYGFRIDPPKGIQKISPQGELLWEYNYLSKTSPIYSITVDSQDNIYVCDWTNHLVKLSKDGKFIWSISINNSEIFGRTLIDSKDNIYYIAKHFFYKISNDGQTIEKFTTSESKFTFVELITIDAIHNDRVWCFDYSGANNYFYRYSYPTDFTSSSTLIFSKSYKAGLK